jgi:PilZ domain
MEKRPESRIQGEVPVRVFGMDADGKPFFQNAVASNLSNDGAQLSRILHSLKSGEIIGIQHGDKKARFEVKWVKSVGAPKTIEAGVMLLPGQTIPWAAVTAANQQGNAPAPIVKPKGMEKRRFTRHKVRFPITIGFPNGSRPHMQCTATDIGGRGCYVESLMPLPIDTEVFVTFWIDSEKVKTKGVIRASDPGVGMGIEFIALEMQIQQKLQEHLAKIDPGFASAAGQSS